MCEKKCETETKMCGVNKSNIIDIVYYEIKKYAHLYDLYNIIIFLLYSPTLSYSLARLLDP